MEIADDADKITLVLSVRHEPGHSIMCWDIFSTAV